MLRFYLENQVISYDEFQKDPSKDTIVSNCLYQVYPSLNVIMGVHYWLYIKTLMTLGTKVH